MIIKEVLPLWDQKMTTPFFGPNYSDFKLHVMVYYTNYCNLFYIVYRNICIH
jgi:hypothetical protein